MQPSPLQYGYDESYGAGPSRFAQQQFTPAAFEFGGHMDGHMDATPQLYHHHIEAYGNVAATPPLFHQQHPYHPVAGAAGARGHAAAPGPG